MTKASERASERARERTREGVRERRSARRRVSVLSLTHTLTAVLTLTSMSVMCATATPTHSLTSPLNMEVEWCLQGGSATFTGFFTEFLGFSSGLRALLPKTRLVPSEFPAPSSSVPSSAFSELAVPPESTLYGELFDKVCVSECECV